MRFKYFCLCIFSLFVLANIPVKAQSLKDTLQLQTIQIIGSKAINKNHETRSEIDSIALNRSITVRLSELLSQNSSIFIKEYGRGAMATASFRGTAPSHTKVNWNGIELNSPMLGMVDFSLIPVYFTEEVKILHGSSSLFESAGALGGSINLVNKANWSNTFSGKLLSSFGSFHTLDEFAQFNLGNSKVQSKSAIFYNVSQNDFPFQNKLNASLDAQTGAYIYGTGRNAMADYQNRGFLQEFYWHAGLNNTISFKTWWQQNERSIPNLLTNESYDAANINRQLENTLRSVAEWKHYSSKSRINYLSGVTNQYSVYKLENKVSGAPNQVVIDAISHILSLINKFSFRYQLKESCSIETGFSVNYHKVISENRKISVSSEGYNVTRFETSLYLKFETQLNRNWSSVFLLREEFIALNHKGLLPLLRINFQPDPSRTFMLNGSASRNIHQPTLNDLFYLPGGNPSLKSEKGNLFDFGATDSYLIGNKQLNAGISFFYSTVNDWIIWLPTFQGFWEPKNIEKVISCGVEANFKLQGSFKSVFYSVKGNYAHTKTENRSVDSPAFRNQLPYIPKNSANLNVHLSYSKIYFDWMWNYYSKRFTTTANSQESVSDYLYPYIMNNVQAGITFPFEKSKLTAECKVLNIFNEDYRTVLQRPMPGRNYQFVLRYDF
ncbi:MAG: TonB-dependent receptor plug domain-containing protein [Prolixibacteraceae bacterium]